MNTEETNKLVKKYQISTETNVKNYYLEKAYKNYTPLFYKLCIKYSILGEIEDLMQECYFALVKAMESYKIDAEYNFMTHLINNVIWHLIKYTNRCNGKSIFLEKAYSILSLNYEMPNEENQEIINLIPGSEDVESQIIDNSMRAWLEEEINKELEHLHPREKEIIVLKYKENRTIEEIAEIYNLSDTRIGQILNNCYKKMRKNEHIIKIHSYYDDAFVLAYKGNVSSFNRTSTSATEKAAFRIMELEDLLKNG